MKGLRKILNLKTTFVDRAQDNRTGIRKAQTCINENTPAGKAIKVIKPYSAVYEERKIKLLNKIIKAEEEDPLKTVTFNTKSLEPVKVNTRPATKRRVGKPRVKWVETGLDSLWKLIGESTRPDLKGSILDPKNANHIRALQDAAEINT